MNTKEKAEGYAMSFFFSETPDDWGFEKITDYLREQDGTFDDMCDRDDLQIWDVFAIYNPSWVADQMDMMAFQLTELFKD